MPGSRKVLSFSLVLLAAAGPGLRAQSAASPEAPADRLISLASGVIDTGAPEPELPETLRVRPAAPGEDPVVLVKFPGPPTGPQIAALEAASLRVYTYLPYYAYLVKLPAGAATAPLLAELGASWSGPFHPAYKISRDDRSRRLRRGRRRRRRGPRLPAGDGPPPPRRRPRRGRALDARPRGGGDRRRAGARALLPRPPAADARPRSPPCARRSPRSPRSSGSSSRDGGRCSTTPPSGWGSPGSPAARPRRSSTRGSSARGRSSASSTPASIPTCATSATPPSACRRPTPATAARSSNAASARSSRSTSSGRQRVRRRHRRRRVGHPGPRHPRGRARWRATTSRTPRPRPGRRHGPRRQAGHPGRRLPRPTTAATCRASAARWST